MRQPSPSPMPAPARLGAHRDLTEKLRAMDMALERVEHDSLGPFSVDPSWKETLAPRTPSRSASGAGASLPEPRGGGGTGAGGEGRGPFGAMHAFSGVRSPSFNPGLGRGDGHAAAATQASTAASSSPASGGGGTSRNFERLESRLERLEGELSVRLGRVEQAWQEALAAREGPTTASAGTAAPGAAELGSAASEAGPRDGVASLADLQAFEVELTSALEARAREADGLLERRLIEVSENLQRRLSNSEVDAQEDRARVAELEAASRVDRGRVTEASQSCCEGLSLAKDQLATLCRRFQQLQEEMCGTHERASTLQREVEELGDQRGVALERIAALAQGVEERLQQMDNRLERGVQEAVQRALEERLADSRQGFQTLGDRLQLLEQRTAADACSRDQLGSSLQMVEAVAATQLEAFRRELDERHGQQLEESKAEYNMCSEHLEAIVNRQQRQQKLIENLLVFDAPSGEGKRRPESPAAFPGRLAALESRFVAAAEAVRGPPSRQDTALQVQETLAEVRAQVAQLQRELSTAPRCGKACTGGELDLPWAGALRDLEKEVKELLALQMEDSTTALRYMAELVEEVRAEMFELPSALHQRGLFTSHESVVTPMLK